MLNWYNTGVTVELREIVESGVDIWDFEYVTPAPHVFIPGGVDETGQPVGQGYQVPFDKKALEQKILDHYWFREIGQETVGRWLHCFRTRMREIMPYYKQLYEFEAKFYAVEDPLESYNLTETYEREHSGSGTASGTASGESGTTSASERSATSEKTVSNAMTRRFSDTPQSEIGNLDDYLTEATREDNLASDDSSESENTSGTTSGTTSESTQQNTEESGTERYTLTRKGNIGVQPLGGEVKNIREAFINIDLMVINEFKDLFLQVY